MVTTSEKTLSVSQAASLCGPVVHSTVVEYWIQTRKVMASRVGKNYAILLRELLFFLK